VKGEKEAEGFFHRQRGDSKKEKWKGEKKLQKRRVEAISSFRLTDWWGGGEHS